jgi:diadenylate cyclase
MMNGQYLIVKNLVDIGLVSFIVYRVLLLIRGTRAVPMLAGLTIIVLMFVLSKQLGLVTVDWILGNFLSAIIVVVVILFQDELRRGLTKVGLQPVLRHRGKTVYNKTVEDITLVSQKMSKAGLGALMVIQREVGLEDLIEDSILVDSLVSRKLLFSIFLKESPLHDGAVLIEGDRIKAAGCVLPLSFDPELDPNLGTRHRAALGISSRSDAVVVVVSEETGSISLAREGRLIRNLDGTQLRDALIRYTSAQPMGTQTEAKLARGL